MNHRRILILADIEGSSGCRDYASGKVTGTGWPEACRRMSRDVDAVVYALFGAGAETITVIDLPGLSDAGHTENHRPWPAPVQSDGQGRPGVGQAQSKPGVIIFSFPGLPGERFPGCPWVCFSCPWQTASSYPGLSDPAGTGKSAVSPHPRPEQGPSPYRRA